MTVEAIARQALKSSVSENAQQVAMTEESRILLADLMEGRMRAAVTEGIKEAMTKDAAAAFAAVFLETMRTQAGQKVDLWAGGIVRSLVYRAALFILAGSIVYSVGGWSALAGLAKWAAASK